jgi:hypothetical protein
MEYVALSEILKDHDPADQFPARVRAAVLERLAAAGTLSSKKDGTNLLLARDADLDRALHAGIEHFVYNMQGWSFAAVRAPIEKVAGALAARTGVTDYTRDVKPARLSKQAGMQPHPDRRDVFAVQFRHTPDWTVLIETVHWIQPADMVMVTLMAAELSRTLDTTAVAAWDDDFSGSTAILCDRGRRTATLNDEDDWATFYSLFYEQGLHLPESFISNADATPSQLHLDDPAAVTRADRFTAAIPIESQTRAPHPFYKLGLMAAALADEDIEDEESFRAAMTDGIWQQVERNLAP